MKEGEIEKYGIDPQGYSISQPLPKPKKVWAKKSDREPSASEVAQIEGEKQIIKSMKEDRHQLLYDVAIKMRSCGYSRDRIEQNLREVAGDNRKLEGKVKGIMKSLEKYG